jgi:hypothetical protein
MCFEYFLGIWTFAMVIIGFCYLIEKSIKTDTELMMSKIENAKLKDENSALKEVIRKQQIIINANEQ